ncbi:hypothetical protein QQ054_36035 [Oscillatoria amoena NRMC-F 0135]|nr:hypothetical protein [Oscillatoria amoena NRMC-F 0135]
MKKSFYAIVGLLIVLGACKTTQTNNPANLAKWYEKAVTTSMYPPAETPDSNLIAITKSNPNLTWKTINGEDYVLMVSWKPSAGYYPDSGLYNTSKWQVWVTASPELKQRFKKEHPKDTNLRLKQLLGLTPTGTYTVFVEFWVRPQDLFRPCPDKEITDTKCNLCFSAKDSLDTDYIKWVNQTRVDRYYTCGLYNQYPWTQLGYTYDWNPANKSHIGLCEFVIDANKNVYVNKIYTTAEYLNKP